MWCSKATCTLGDRVRIGAERLHARDARSATTPRYAPTASSSGAVGAGAAVIGPFARLRPARVLAEDVHVGNFVEVKKARIGAAPRRTT